MPDFVRLDPDFNRLRTVLMLEGEPDRVPNVELHADWQIKQAFLGRPITGIRAFVAERNRQVQHMYQPQAQMPTSCS